MFSNTCKPECLFGCSMQIWQTSIFCVYLPRISSTWSNDVSFLLGDLETSMASNRFSKVRSKAVILEDVGVVVLSSSHA